MTTLNRRNFLTLGSITTTAVFLSQCSRRSPLDTSVATSKVLSKSTPITQPKMYYSQDGLLRVDLTAQTQSIQLGDGLSELASRHHTAQLLAYNGQVPGPCLEAKPGDTVQIRFTNQLNQPTNLHFHGLHISPEIDNVFREVPPEEQHIYEFQIPIDHPATTAWYHPHYHLNVAEQVFGGLAGPFIIRGDVDNIPEINQAEEAVLVLQDVGIDSQGTVVNPHSLAKKWGREGEVLRANGQQNPVVAIPQNSLLRLRLINASASRIYKLQLQGHPWFLMATDRGAIPQPIEQDTVILSPGERAELLIPGQQEPGDYRLINLPYDRGLEEMVDAFGLSSGQLPGVALPKEQAIATLRYQPSHRATPLALPQSLATVELLPDPITTREFVLDHGLDATAPTTGFTINGQSFAMNRVNTQVHLNQVEDWHIINKASMDHPFHLHTNRFQVMARNGQPEPLIVWKDTVNIKAYETVTIRVRFDDFTGRTVYHCHILDHEDQGMMGVLDILES